jgi:2-polyprenyl-3-methyl-5-hydroxy-6-metoxy-1,4-benzoquinol methylase
MKCDICENGLNNSFIYPKETMFGLNETFQYMMCGNCGCLQLKSEGVCFEKYYDTKNYYSFSAKAVRTSSVNFFRRLIKIAKRRIFSIAFSLGLADNLKYIFRQPFWISRRYLNTNSRVLDYGCGAGDKLKLMWEFGFKNLVGFDPFLSDELVSKAGSIQLINTVNDLGGDFDFIMLHHSFEHVNNPLEVLKLLFGKLAPEGIVVIRLPISSSYAYRRYGINWIQLDAPRHVYLHSIKSLGILVKKANFILKDVVYDSDCMQFIGSHGAELGVPWVKNSDIFDRKLRKKYNRLAKVLNKEQDGDQVALILTKA